MERACIELAQALGVDGHGGWRDLLARVRTMASVPGGVGQVYDDVKAALGAHGGDGATPWQELVAEVKVVRDRADSVKDILGDLAEAMGLVRGAPGDWSALLERVRQWRSDRVVAHGDRATSKTAICDIAKALGHDYDANVATILDSIIRLKETNLLLEIERGTELAEEKAAHARTKAAYDGLLMDIGAALDPLLPTSGQVSVTSTARAVVAEVLSLREQVAVLSEAMARSGERDSCESCGGPLCEGCGNCTVGPGYGDPACDVHMVHCTGSPAVEVEPAIAALESLTAAMATDPRDWAASRLDAWLWGVIVGWPPAALDEVASRHGWPDEIKKRLRFLHAAVLESCGHGDAW